MRLSLRVVVVAGLVIVGWSLGRAQSPNPSDFELRVSVANGTTAVQCVRGCTLTWAPKTGNEVHVPTTIVNGRTTADGCVAGQFVQGSCRIWGWKK